MAPAKSIMAMLCPHTPNETTESYPRTRYPRQDLQDAAQRSNEEQAERRDPADVLRTPLRHAKAPPDICCPVVLTTSSLCSYLFWPGARSDGLPVR
jgi:hypothetical protein